MTGYCLVQYRILTCSTRTLIRPELLRAIPQPIISFKGPIAAGRLTSECENTLLICYGYLVKREPPHVSFKILQ